MSHNGRSQWRRGKGKARRRRTRVNEKGGWEQLNKRLARSKLQTAHVSNVSGARRQILAGKQGQAGPRLRLCSHTLTSVNQRQTPKPDANLCMHVNLPLDKKKCEKLGQGHQAARPSWATGRRPPGHHGPWAAWLTLAMDRRPLDLWVAGPLGRLRAVGCWAAGLLLAKPLNYRYMYLQKRQLVCAVCSQPCTY